MSESRYEIIGAFTRIKAGADGIEFHENLHREDILFARGEIGIHENMLEKFSKARFLIYFTLNLKRRLRFQFYL
jgi:hypothetical protein